MVSIFSLRNKVIAMVGDVTPLIRLLFSPSKRTSIITEILLIYYIIAQNANETKMCTINTLEYPHPPANNDHNREK